MSAVLAREVSYALYGTWRLARLDPTGLVFFDRSVDGFWRSWWSLAFVYPAGLIISAIVAAPDAPQPDFARVAALQLIGNVIAYAAFPLLVLALTRIIDRSSQFFDYIVAYNWSQVPLAAAFLLIAALDGSGVFGEYGWYAYQPLFPAWYAYHTYLALVSLRAGALPAIVLVVLDVVLGMLITATVDKLY